MDTTRFIKRYWATGLGAVLGALGGWLYYTYIGCSSGSCPITSSLTLSILWGTVMGGLLFDMLPRKDKTNKIK